MLEPSALPILFEDEFFVAIDKPPGMLVHRTKLDSQEQVFAVQMVRNQIGGHVYPVHRLDKPTSGVLLFGKSSEAAKAFSLILQANEVTKTYQAIVRGWTADEDTIDYALKERLDKTTDSKARTDRPPQQALTRFSRISKTELPDPVGRYQTARYSLLSIQPETGRKHQIRRHFKHIFHPVIGDRKYGDRDHNAFFRSHLGISRLLLAATKLGFLHPFSKENVLITANNGFPDIILSHFQG